MVDVTLAAVPGEPVPFEEAERFFGDKLLLTPQQFAALREEAQSRAFAVAGIAKMDALATVHGALERAISEGSNLADFQKSVAGLADEAGWTDFRLETIFRTNLGQAYEAGHWAQLQELGAGAVVVYDAIDDSDTRPTHAAMDRKAYPADDPIWNTWWPPNGFNCRCTTQTMSAEEAEARGVQVESTSAGLPQPDPGFAHNPGKGFFGDAAGPSADDWSDAEDLPGPSRYTRPAAADVPRANLPAVPSGRLLPDGLSADEYSRRVRQAFGIADGQLERVVTDAVGDAVVLSAETAGAAGAGGWAPVLPEVLQAPFEVWLVPVQLPDGRVALRRRFVQLWADGGGLVADVQKGRLVAVRTAGPEALETIDAARQGALLKGAP